MRNRGALTVRMEGCVGVCEHVCSREGINQLDVSHDGDRGVRGVI